MDKLLRQINSQAMANFTLVVYCLSFFIWSGGLMYSVWLGLFALVWRLKIEKRALRKLPKKFFWWVCLAYLMPIISDFVNVAHTHNISAFDRFSYLIMVFVIWEFVTSKRMFHLLAVLWCVSLCVSFVGAVPSFMVWLKNPVTRVRSFFDIMRYGHMLGPAIVIVFGWFVFGAKETKQKLVLAIVFLLGLLVLIGNGTRGVWLAVVPTLFCMSLFRPRYLFILATLVAVTWFSAGDKYQSRVKSRIVSAFDTSKKASHSNQLRMIFWESAWMTFQQHPLFGTGTKGFEKPFVQNIAKLSKSDYSNKHYPRNQNNAHNSYLTVLAKYGLFGALPLLLLLWIKIPYEIFWYLRQKKKLPPMLMCGFFALYSFLFAAMTENSVLAKSGNTITICFVLILFTIFQRFEDEIVKD